MEEEATGKLGCYGSQIRVIEKGADSAAEETILLWGIQQPISSKPNAFVSQSSLQLRLDACGHSLLILQSPSSLGRPGVTGAVIWDSGVVLAKFLEHAVDSKNLHLKGKKVIELGSGCGLVGCIAALLGSHVILTDLPDRLRLLNKNVETNTCNGMRGSATVKELTWGDDLAPDIVGFSPDVILGSDVVYSEDAVADLLRTMAALCSDSTTVFIAGELRNDAILEHFLEAAMEQFEIGRVRQNDCHPDFRSPRVVIYVLVKRMIGVR